MKNIDEEIAWKMQPILNSAYMNIKNINVESMTAVHIRTYSTLKHFINNRFQFPVNECLIHQFYL